jgi:hypothetical protein
MRCIAIFVLGCGHAAPSPQPTPVGQTHVVRAIDAGAVSDAAALEDDLPRLAGRAVALYQAWQKALVDAGEDCAKATANLNAVADQYADVIAANERILKGGHDKIAALKQALAAHEQEMDTAAEGIMHSKALATCTQDRAFVKALDRIGGSPP